jgi:hypothetical protein
MPDATSRRALLATFVTTPIVATMVASPWTKALAQLGEQYGDTPPVLSRSLDGRALSRDRYHSAEVAFAPIEAGFFSDPRHIRDTLHCAGAVAKLGLCAYLLDIGFADAWNAEHIRQDITKALAYANATGFGRECPEMARLAHILTPYWKWGYPTGSAIRQWTMAGSRTSAFVRSCAPCWIGCET